MEQDLGCQLLSVPAKAFSLHPLLRGSSRKLKRSPSPWNTYGLCLSLQGEICGSLKIGVSVNIARYKLPAVLKTFMKKYPKVDIYVTTMQSTQLYRALADNEISIALVRGNF